MKHFLHSGYLLRSAFEVDLKMSSFLYQRNVLRGKKCNSDSEQGEKKENVQMETSTMLVVFSASI